VSRTGWYHIGSDWTRLACIATLTFLARAKGLMFAPDLGGRTMLCYKRLSLHDEFLPEETFSKISCDEILRVYGRYLNIYSEYLHVASGVGFLFTEVVTNI